MHIATEPWAVECTRLLVKENAEATIEIGHDQYMDVSRELSVGRGYGHLRSEGGRRSTLLVVWIVVNTLSFVRLG